MRRNIYFILALAGILLTPACQKNDPSTKPGTASGQAGKDNDPSTNPPDAKTDSDTKTDNDGKTDNETNTDAGTDDNTDTDTDVEDPEIILPPDNPEFREVLCGNGLIDPGESCDDKNRLGHDGCNKYCQVERGYYCTNEAAGPSECHPICGNGRLDENEACDDGNTDNHDGCNNKCQFEDKFDCDTDNLPTKCFAQQFFGSGTCDDPIIFTGNNLIYSGDKFAQDFSNTVTFCTTSYTDNSISYSNKDAVFQINLKKGQLLLVHANTKGDMKSFITKGACRNKPPCTLIRDIGKNNGNYDYYYAANDETVTLVISSYLENHYPYEIIIEKSQPICGDGRLIPLAEECDDGNTDDGDGCDHNCQIEENSTCYKVYWSGGQDEVRTCTTTCGNGKVSSSEECDDGNNQSGDGCSATCHVEEGYHCISGKPCEKDSTWVGSANGCKYPGIMIGDEIHLQGDDFETDFPNNNLNMKACASNKTDGYNEATFRVDLQAGDVLDISDYALAALSRGECANVKCSNTLSRQTDPESGETFWRFSATRPETVWVVFENNYQIGTRYEKSYDLWIKRYRAVCGDGLVAADFGEQCEDGNDENGDGCDSNCRVEKYWSCDNTVSPSFCTINGTDGSTDHFSPIELDNSSPCGNGVLDNLEQCDDANTENGDGCDEKCQVEWGYSCSTNEEIRPDLRCKDACGNGRLDYVETCDDGNFIDGDGCDANCQTEDGYICFGAGDSCVKTVLKSGTADSASSLGVVDGSFYGFYSDFAAIFTNTFKLWGDNCHDIAYSTIAPEAIYKVTLKAGDILTVVANAPSMVATSINLVHSRDYGVGGSRCIPSTVKNGRLTYTASEDITLLVVLEATAPNEANWHGAASIYITIEPAN